MIAFAIDMEKPLGYKRAGERLVANELVETQRLDGGIESPRLNKKKKNLRSPRRRPRLKPHFSKIRLNQRDPGR